MSFKNLFGHRAKKVRGNSDIADPHFDRLRFYSTKALERRLDGSEERFATYFYSIYHCLPNEESDVSNRRDALRLQYPDKAIKINERRFVLVGAPAYQIIAAYFKALIAADTLSEEYRAYKAEHLELVQRKHRDSQGLPVPVDLTEGQLAHDERVERYTLIALRNGQIVDPRDLA